MKNIFDNIMVDIETLGTKSNSVILSIGAVQFDITTSKTSKTFYQVLDLNETLKNSEFKIDASTLIWWINQNKKAKEVFENKNRIHPLDGINNLKNWISEINTYDDIKIWGNSNRFDLGLLENYFTYYGFETPWSYKNERDIRTLVALAPEIKNNHKWIGTSHNALDDCYNQIAYCSKIWKKLKKVK